MNPNPASMDAAMHLVDQAIASGALVVKDGSLALSDADATDARLGQLRDETKLSELQSEDDSRPQERIILGYVLSGDTDNSTRWAKFRSAVGLHPLQGVPNNLWSDPAINNLANEIDAVFHGKRDIHALNARALIDSMSLRSEREQTKVSLQNFSRLVTELAGSVGDFVENDFRIAIEILQSKRARAMLRQAGRNLEHALKADRPVEDVVKDLGMGLYRAKQVVAGRLGDDLELDDFEAMHGMLLSCMEAEKSEPISTGIRAFDIDLQGGVNPLNTGKLNVIGARTGVGKTSCGIAAAMGLTLNGAHVLFMSCELDASEIAARAMSHYAAKNNAPECRSWILEGRGTRRTVPKGYYELMDLWVEQRQSQKIGDFKSKALFHATAEDFVEYIYAAKAKDPRLSAVFLDHFHALKPSKGFNNRSQEMEARILYLHQAAKACKVDLFLMAQLNREACLAKNPSLEHINGTDAIAQLATAVWLLEFPKREEGAPFDPHSLVCHHAKFRNGQRDANGHSVSEDQTPLTISREYCLVSS